MSRWVRLRGPTGAVRLGRLLDETRVQLVRGDLFGLTEDVGEPELLSSWTLLAPLRPSKVVGVASNYRDHAAEMGKPVPASPRIFLMPGTAVIGPDDAIRIPPDTQRVDHEAELGVVIGRTMRRVPAEKTLAHVLGYTVVNDVTARDFQRSDGIFGRAKGFDTFCPIGPCIATELDPSSVSVQAWVDGELRQDGTTADMVFDVPTLLEWISHVMTLLPGDVVATGTPAGVGPVRAGQRVRVSVEGIGALENPVVDRSDRAVERPTEVGGAGDR